MVSMDQPLIRNNLQLHDDDDISQWGLMASQEIGFKVHWNDLENHENEDYPCDDNQGQSNYDKNVMSDANVGDEDKNKDALGRGS